VGVCVHDAYVTDMLCVMPLICQCVCVCACACVNVCLRVCTLAYD